MDMEIEIESPFDIVGQAGYMRTLTYQLRIDICQQPVQAERGIPYKALIWRDPSEPKRLRQGAKTSALPAGWGVIRSEVSHMLT